MNEFIKRILVIIILTLSLSVFSQNKSWGFKSYENHIFRNTGISYDSINKKLLVATIVEPRKGCRVQNNPFRYECHSIGGFPSKTFITQFDKSDDFNVSVFDRHVKTDDALVSVTTFVRNGKVVQQSQCFYDGQMTANGNDKKNHYTISKMKCYVVTPELADVLLRIQSMEEFKAPKAYNEFINVLKSPEYKKAIMEAHTYNWRQAFLSLNSLEEFTFDYYSKLKKGFYDHEKYENDKILGIVNLEQEPFVKESKSLFEIYSKENTLMSRVFDKPSENLTESKLMAEIKTKE